MNQEQAGGQCADFEVRFCCPQFKTAECDGPQSTWTGWYNDEWGKKDEKIWVSNREEREELQMYGDGGACSTPTASEIRPRPTGSVSYQTTMWQYATNLVDHLSPDGYLCINEEQVNGFKVIIYFKIFTFTVSSIRDDISENSLLAKIRQNATQLLNN